VGPESEDSSTRASCLSWSSLNSGYLSICGNLIGQIRVKEDNVPGGVLAKDFLEDVALGQVSLDLSQCELFQLGYVVLGPTSVRVGRMYMRTRHLVGESVDRLR